MRCSLSLLLLCGLLGFVTGCDAIHLVGEDGPLTPCQMDEDCAIDAICDRERHVCVRPGATRNIDILLLIDNSASMAQRQQALIASFKLVFQKLEAAGASYHVAVATSDVGSTPAPGATWGGAAGSCETFAGDDGQLQAVPCTHRSGLTADAVAGCNRFCPDPSFIPSGLPFIAKDGAVSNVPAALVVGAQPGTMFDLGPQKAFQCMALVGDTGCGIEGPLEGARRALDGHRPENAGFLRPDSVLAVLFLTDEDDCSVQLGRRRENDPQSFDCPGPDVDASYLCFNTDYRCLAHSVRCTEPLNTPGDKTDCTERQDSYLEPVQTYIDFFAALRPSSRLLLGGIWTLPALDRGGQLRVETPLAGQSGSERLNRVPQPCHSASPGNPGAPQLRLSQLVAQFATRGGLEADLCNEDAYATALDRMTDTILRKAGLLIP